jgi:hypothetical protein
MFDLLTYDNEGRPRLTVTVENLTPTLAVFTAKNALFPTANYATKDIRNVYSVLDFDDTTNEKTIFLGLMPKQYRGGNIEVHLHFMMTTATSGDVDWIVYFDRFGSNDIDVDTNTWSNTTTVTDTSVPSTSGQIAITTVTVTEGANMDNITAGDLFSIQIERDASTDTATGDAELLGVEIRGT